MPTDSFSPIAQVVIVGPGNSFSNRFSSASLSCSVRRMSAICFASFASLIPPAADAVCSICATATICVARVGPAIASWACKIDRIGMVYLRTGICSNIETQLTAAPPSHAWPLCSSSSERNFQRSADCCFGSRSRLVGSIVRRIGQIPQSSWSVSFDCAARKSCVS